MDRLQELAAMAALNKMFKDGHFSICTIRNIAEMTKVSLGGRAYEILCTLHCVDYANMGRELREALPGLVRECLSLSPIYEFEHLKQQKVVISISPMQRFMKAIS